MTITPAFKLVTSFLWLLWLHVYLCVCICTHMFLISYFNYQAFYIFSISSIFLLWFLDLHGFLLRQPRDGQPWKGVTGIIGSSPAWPGLGERGDIMCYLEKGGVEQLLWNRVLEFYSIIKSWWLMRVQIFFIQLHCILSNCVMGFEAHLGACIHLIMLCDCVMNLFGNTTSTFFFV